MTDYLPGPHGVDDHTGRRILTTRSMADSIRAVHYLNGGNDPRAAAVVARLLDQDDD